MLKVEQADRDVAAAITGDEAMAYGMSDLSDAVQRVAKHREDTALPLREALEAALKVAVDRANELSQAARDSGRRNYDDEAYEVRGVANKIRAIIKHYLSPDTTGGE